MTGKHEIWQMMIEMKKNLNLNLEHLGLNNYQSFLMPWYIECI